MTITIKHNFISSYADDADASLVRPSNWNDTHSVIGAEDQANKNQLSGYAGVDANGFVTPNGYAADTGTANTYAITLSPAPAALAAGQRVRFKVANANTGASTLNVNGLGAKSLVKSGSTALASGDLAAGQIVTAVYDGTSWQLQGVGGGSGGDLTAEYIIGATDVSLTNARVWPGLYNHPDAPPSSAGTLDDEFDDATFNTNAKWTWVNQGTASASQTKSWLGLTAPNGAGDNWRLIMQSAPSTPWEVTAKIVLLSPASNYRTVAIILRESSTGKIIDFGLSFSGSFQLVLNNYTSPTAFSSQSFTMASNGNAIYLKVKDDGTNLIYSFSYDGVHFLQVASLGRTAFLASGPNQVGLGADSNNTAAPNLDVTLCCEWFRRTL